MKDGVFISGLASLSLSLPHNTIHSFLWDRGSYLVDLLYALWSFDWVCQCLWHLYMHTGGVGESRAAILYPRGRSWLQGPCPPLWPLLSCWGSQAWRRWWGGGGCSMEATEQRRCGAGSCPLTDRIWSMSCCRGSRPSLRTQTYLQCICQAACAVTLSPLQATSVFLLGWEEDGGRMEGGREKGGVYSEGREEHEAGRDGRGLNVKLPLQRPAKSLSYMENTSRLQGNRTTSEFLQTKIALMSGCDLSVLWPMSLSVCLSHSNSHTTTKLMLKPKQPSRTISFTAVQKKKEKFNNCAEQSVFIIPLFSWMEMTSWWPNVWTSIEVPLVSHFII